MLTAEDLPEGVTLDRVNAWYDRFRFYRHSPSREELVAWLKQFAAEHQLLGAKVLDEVILLSDIAIQQGYHNALAGLPGWSEDETQRSGTWAFVGLGGQAESGPAMLHMFREANGLTSDRYQNLFVTLADLPDLRLTARDTVVFVDDFSGTGDQFSSRWAVYQELVSSEARTYLFLAAATSFAIERLARLDDLEVRAEMILGPERNVFDEASATFSADERVHLMAYCRRADRRNPRGWGDCGVLLVISRKTPNNSLPILHVTKPRWKGVFPRKLPIIGAPPAIAA